MPASGSVSECLRLYLGPQVQEIHTLRLHPVGVGIYIADKTLEIKQIVENGSAAASGQIRAGRAACLAACMAPCVPRLLVRLSGARQSRDR